MDKLSLRDDLYHERGYRCEREGCNRPASDLHHGIIGDKKRFKEVLFCKENLFLSCRSCNVSREMDNDKQRQAFWLIQCSRYGLEHMQKWLASIPSKMPLFVPLS